MLSTFERFELISIPIMMFIALILAPIIGYGFLGSQTNELILVPMIEGFIIGVILFFVIDLFIFPLTEMKRFVWHFRVVSLILVFFYAIFALFGTIQSSILVISWINGIFGLGITLLGLSALATYWHVLHPQNATKSIEKSIVYRLDRKIRQLWQQRNSNT